jgi:DNA-nicking Smr family endonuclease
MSASGRRGKQGSLSKEDRALWKGVTRGIKPLRATPVAEDSEDLPATRAASVPVAPILPLLKQLKSKTPPPLAPLGRRMKQRVARGKETIDDRLDLHGYTQAQAHGALRHFLSAAQARGTKLVVVVTGKGGSRRADGEGESGVLRRQVPLWLKLPEFRALVVGFETAHRAHGGEGALYVRVRRTHA